MANDLSLILVPPNHGKTTAIGIEYVVWRIVYNRDVRIMYVSKTQAFARKGLYAIKKRLSDPSWYEANGYRNLVREWGPFKPGRDDRGTPWTADLIYVPASSRLRRTRRSRRWGSATRSTERGRI